MRYFNFLAATLLLVAPVLAQGDVPDEDDAFSRPCGFRIAPCPAGSTCSWSDPACPMTRGENCPGRCKATSTEGVNTRPTREPTRPGRPDPTILPPPTRTSESKTCVTTTTTSKTRTTTITPRPTPPHRYEDCGGKRIVPKDCPEGFVCIDNPYRSGCGMACDAPGICVEPTFCGGIAGIQCRDGKKCFDNPLDECDPRRGGRDCGGICV